jgi:hypothetical protein
MLYFIKNYITNILKIFNIIKNKKYTNDIQFYNCMSELIILFKKTYSDINDIYFKYILNPKLNNLFV